MTGYATTSSNWHADRVCRSQDAVHEAIVMMLRDARCGCTRGRRRLFTMAFSQFREHTVLNLFDSKVENSVGRFFLQNSKRSKNVSKLTFLLLFYLQCFFIFTIESILLLYCAQFVLVDEDLISV